MSGVLLLAPATTAVFATPAQSQSRTEAKVFAIGDSVMLGAEPCLENHGYDVDARGSRRVAAVAQELAAKATLPRQVIVHTGTNGGADPPDLDKVMRVVGSRQQIIWVTVQLPDNTGRYTFEESTNAAIRALPRLYPNAHVADWNALSNDHPGWTWGDGIHLTPDGCRGFARMVANEVRHVEILTEHYVPMRPTLSKPTAPGTIAPSPTASARGEVSFWPPPSPQMLS